MGNCGELHDFPAAFESEAACAMTAFLAYADNFELYPKDGEAARHLAPLLSSLNRIDFTLSVADPTVNQGQIASDFDTKLECKLRAGGATPFALTLPPGVPQELDFSFTFCGCNVAVEIEKANWEKILRDFLKCHISPHAGAHFALVALPRNYAHKHGVWNLFEFMFVVWSVAEDDEHEEPPDGR